MIERLFVSFPVSLDLLHPERRVASRKNAVLETSVPEASVHKNRDLGRPENDIRSSVEVGERATVNAIPETSLEQRRAQGQFRLRIAPSVTPHGGSCCGARRP